jgi:glycosyltransferase involved in cell wall biosynthesis
MIPCAAAVVSPVTGRALSEAALGGAPIVAYDIDWQGDIIRTGETGEIVPYLDWAAMAESVDRFLKDPDYAHAMGRAVREAALQMFDTEALDQHERVQYEAMIARSRPKARAAGQRGLR